MAAILTRWCYTVSNFAAHRACGRSCCRSFSRASRPRYARPIETGSADAAAMPHRRRGGHPMPVQETFERLVPEFVPADDVPTLRFDLIEHRDLTELIPTEGIPADDDRAHRGDWDEEE